MLRASFVGLSCFLFFGCASSGSAPVEPSATVVADADTGGIGAQQLAIGECGLFLWTVAEPRRFIFFSKAGSEEALVRLEGKSQRVVQSKAGGDIFGQFMTELAFEPESGEGQLTLTIEPGALLEQGQRTQSARLTFRNADGWEMIIPVAGVRACQNE